MNRWNEKHHYIITLKMEKWLEDNRLQKNYILNGHQICFQNQEKYVITSY